MSGSLNRYGIFDRKNAAVVCVSAIDLYYDRYIHCSREYGSGGRGDYGRFRIIKQMVERV